MGFWDYVFSGNNGSKNLRRSGNNRNVSPMEKYIREEERWHSWECPHDDPYDCDGDCF